MLKDGLAPDSVQTSERKRVPLPLELVTFGGNYRDEARLGEDRLTKASWLKLEHGIKGGEEVTLHPSIDLDAGSPLDVYILRTTSDSWRWLHDHETDVLIDGAPCRVRASFKSKMSEGILQESVNIPIPQADWSRWCLASQVEIRIGRDVYEIDDLTQGKIAAMVVEWDARIRRP